MAWSEGCQSGPKASPNRPHLTQEERRQVGLNTSDDATTDDDLIAKLRAFPELYSCHAAADALVSRISEVERLRVQVMEAYREGWHEGYATGDAAGSYSAVENDWLGSEARAALSQHRKV